MADLVKEVNGGCNGVDEVLVLVKSMAIDDHFSQWVNDVRKMFVGLIDAKNVGDTRTLSEM